MLKELLFISYHFPPFSKILSIRAAEFTKRLAKDGFKIFVVSAKSNKNEHKDISLLKDVKSPQIINKRVFNISIAKEGIQSKVNKRALYTQLFNFLLFLHWIPLAFLSSRKITRKNNIKLVYVSAPPFYSLVLGWLLKFFSKIPLVIEYRDPWSHNPYQKKNFSKLLEKAYLKMEKAALNSADIIITISEGMKDFLLENFPETSKKFIKAIPHGVKFGEIEKIKEKIKKNNEILITFTGNLYGLRDIEPLVKIISYLDETNNLNDISLKIKIFGRYDSKYLTSLFKKYAVSKYFHLEGFVPRRICLEEVYNSSLALHVGENLNYPTLSFKILEYMSMRKKLIYIGREDSYTAKFLEKYSLGITLPINNYEVGVKRFEELLEGLKKQTFQTNLSLDELYQFSWDERYNDLIKIIDYYYHE